MEIIWWPELSIEDRSQISLLENKELQSQREKSLRKNTFKLRTLTKTKRMTTSDSAVSITPSLRLRAPSELIFWIRKEHQVEFTSQPSMLKLKPVMIMKKLTKRSFSNKDKLLLLLRLLSTMTITGNQMRISSFSYITLIPCKNCLERILELEWQLSMTTSPVKFLSKKPRASKS